MDSANEIKDLIQHWQNVLLSIRINEDLQKTNDRIWITEEARCDAILPLKSPKDLIDLDNELKINHILRSVFFKRFAKFHRLNLSKFLMRSFKMVICDELAAMCTWKGRIGKPRIANLKLVSLLKDIAQQLYPNATDARITFILRKCIWGAKGRLLKQNNKKAVKK
ncbi:uncharacterized protein LOC142237070 [Haematobia irritans]|uniref:uncharacterized protein LOC142237070 n=1 Tax=Haematobia irritans TaxID=7368 RepID=UPI003F4F7748